MRKFDVAVGNPPYQLDTQDETASRRSSIDIFPQAQELVSFTSSLNSLIYPATWQKNPTKDLGLFLRNNGLKISTYFNGSDVFPHIRAGYPISLVFNETGYKGSVIINGNPRPRYEEVWLDDEEKVELYELTKQLPKYDKAVSFFSNVSSALILPSEAKLLDLQTKDITQLPPLNNDEVYFYVKRTPGVQPDGSWHKIDSSYMKNTLLQHKETWGKYKVAIPSAPIGRMRFFNFLLEKNLDLSAQVLGPDHYASNTFAYLDYFNTKEEAESFKEYVNSRDFLVLASLDISRKSFASYAPASPFRDKL